MKKTAGLLLAAGESRRLGQAKQLLVKDGKTLLRHSAEVITAAKVGVLHIVLGAEAERMKFELQNIEYQEVINADFKQGMSSSIAAGMKTVSDFSGALICLTDQPYLTSEIIKSVVKKGESTGKIVRCRYTEGSGPPVYFPARYFPELRALQGDTGAQPVVKKHLSEVLTVDFPPGHLDIDTPSDLERWS